ncbi:Alpha/beta hydrolase family protein [Gemmata sp. SH-PL17]|uniref:alpha/beta hydrolase n=1 Tax=Gemmata sp. SH-PL17 TaxID=1630693 RepID=UPI00078C4656|nr:hypothetical protein [Gemmata sp. SH-PL17]AMV30354.1 Alpha/beta hydrolase family protein [Gemmata sp. SH-PL17]
MRRWLAAPVAFAVAIGLSSLHVAPVKAQPKGEAPVEESFLTADGVQLKGLFHATNKDAATAPVAVLLYAPGPDRDMTKGDWAGLAGRLNEAGYHVFRFDWRGHGKSTEIKDPKKFWNNPFLNGGNVNYNGYIKGGPPKKPLKNDLYYKDLSPTRAERYLPAYLNDLAAVRLHLDSKNDNKTLNTSSIYLIGTGDAAALGLGWIATEWSRPAVFPKEGQLGVGVPGYEFVPQQLVGQFPPEGGHDIAGAVWISPNRPALISEAATKKWISTYAPKIRENNPMLFLYADKDAAGKKQSEFFYNEVLVGDPRRAKAFNLAPISDTFIKEVKGGSTLNGVKLLDNNAELKVQDTIIQFMAAIQKERAKLPSKNRNYSTPYFINAQSFGFAATP